MGQKDGVINIATGLFQSIAADDVAVFVINTALPAPRNTAPSKSLDAVFGVDDQDTVRTIRDQK